MRTMIECVHEDKKDIKAFYNCTFSSSRTHRLKDYFEGKLADLRVVPYEQLDPEGQTDYVLLQKHLHRQLQGLESMEASHTELAPLVEPFASDLVALLERRQKVTSTAGKYAADVLSVAGVEVRSRCAKIEEGQLTAGAEADRFAAYRAVNVLDELQRLLREWFGFYNGYDPTFTWWVSRPHELLIGLLQDLAEMVRDKLVGSSKKNDDAIVGQPTGSSSILADLDAQFIAYSPEELIKIAEKEYTWCEGEMIKASVELGYERDWKAALEHVKNMYVEPGQQTYLVHELAEEAVAYVKKHDMVTIPPIAEECWRTYMMSPARQKVNPFFLGGESMVVSYPTNTMSHEEKLMSMRGNSGPLSRSTVFHELIPGHHLQYHMIARYCSYRSLFSTPFWMEGWAFYWEFLLYDSDFTQKPEDRIGMLFWRMHRCARIVFSIKFHLGEMTPQECIDYLVEKVGHERATAEGEVRRSFAGDYSPLYQAGYMLGALQFRALRKEAVDEGGMSEKEFHDRVLKQGEMPIEILRALLIGKSLSKDHKASWRFYDL
ncbi:hypothetical protein LTR36_007915 [Oleoguttula mirabilis]|uniref:X-Pro dipeptidyl-peptidase n=1 Tax=Oleoguttula mirabilis TaxID=1507867 RepID=A0AAV9J9A4_9PEZI|nr:hypothetical protein LTR36_007915 [Oleoguttula mirabilis]